ncbi:hypothetical protein BZG36_01451 [Bifiguratus adelaidae]|uniref:Uncharacterized protein n=1 Tax=Bifiguratus adelaidae TaxID=1938954 RepID=A0A261Y524_9FUNG|nr:hypothetical protein BZG36_01451 [Bifiguratus adelaidae]
MRHEDQHIVQVTAGYQANDSDDEELRQLHELKQRYSTAITDAQQNVPVLDRLIGDVKGLGLSLNTHDTEDDLVHRFDKPTLALLSGLRQHIDACGKEIGQEQARLMQQGNRDFPFAIKHLRAADRALQARLTEEAFVAAFESCKISVDATAERVNNLLTALKDLEFYIPREATLASSAHRDRWPNLYNRYAQHEATSTHTPGIVLEHSLWLPSGLTSSQSSLSQAGIVEDYFAMETTASEDGMVQASSSEVHSSAKDALIDIMSRSAKHV